MVKVFTAITIFALVSTIAGCSPMNPIPTKQGVFPLTNQSLKVTANPPFPSTTPTRITGSFLPINQIVPGDYLVYTSPKGLEIGSPDGSKQYFISKGIEGWASFSPDLEYLAYINDNRAFLVNLKNSIRKQLQLDGEVPYSTPSWSPDGRNVLFNVYKDFAMNLVMYTIPSDSYSMITDCAGFEMICDSPKWSFDGRNILYKRILQTEHRDTGEEGLFLLDSACIENHSCQEGAGPIGDLSEYAWSPNGQQIAGRKDNELVIYRFSDKRLLDEASLGKVKAYPVLLIWSPDGKSLVAGLNHLFGSPTPPPNEWTTYVYNVVTKERRVLNIPPHAVIQQWISIP